MPDPKQTSGMIILLAITMVMIAVIGIVMIGAMQNYKPQTVVTITDKASFTIPQGFFSSRTAFYIITDKGNFEVGRTGGSDADVYALWSRMKIGHKYNLDIQMDLVVGATEVY